jgi:hypothetical protein
MELDREGDFRIEITSYGLYEADSGSVAVNLEANVLECWNPETQAWEDWRQYNVATTGSVWIVKKDGKPNEKGVESLIRCAGWNGRPTSITQENWRPKPCQASCKRDEYQGQVRFKIAFLNPWDRTPGGMGNVSPEKAKELELKFGSQFKAMHANFQRQEAGPPEGSQPQSPPPLQGVNPHQQANAAAHQKESEDEIPF